MSRNRRLPGRPKYKDLPLTYRNNIPKDDGKVLQNEPVAPLEMGGVYTEMGADFTYEQLHSSPVAHDRVTNYDETGDVPKAQVTYVGSLAIIFGILSLFIWPFWMSLATFALGYISYMQNTKRLAYISFLLASVAMIIAIVNYFNSI